MRIMAITGAGISVKSGGFTYRGPGGLYTDSDVEALMTAKTLYDTPHKIIPMLQELQDGLKNLLPNDMHMALAKLEDNHEVIVVTQNVDGLHQMAGSSNVAELHGSMRETTTRYGHEIPNIVLFGDPIKSVEYQKAIDFGNKGVDLLLVIGTTMNFGYLWDLYTGCLLDGADRILVDPDPQHRYRSKFEKVIHPDQFRAWVTNLDKVER